MKTIADYKIEFDTIELDKQVQEFLEFYGKKEVAVHSVEVADEAKKMAKIFGLQKKKLLLQDYSMIQV